MPWNPAVYYSPLGLPSGGPIERDREECLESVQIRPCHERAGLVEQGIRHPISGELFPGDWPKAEELRFQVLRHAVIFLGLTGARRIDEASSRRNEPRGLEQHQPLPRGGNRD